MSTIVTRAGKGSPLTWNEVDNNFTNLNTDKYQSGSNVSLGTIAGTTITSSALTSGRVTFASTGGLLADSGDLTWSGTSLLTPNLVLPQTAWTVGTGGANASMVGYGSTGGGGITNTLIFNTNGSERLRLNANGFLGIGTTDPNVILTINKNQADGIRIRSADSNGTRLSLGVDTVAGVTYMSSSREGSGTFLPLAFYTSDLERMRIDSSGNLGIGVTPSTWSAPFKVMQLGTYGQHVASQTNTADIKVGANNYYNGTNYVYTVTGYGAAQYNVSGNTGYQWHIAPSGTAGNAITFTQAMTLDASGNLGLGVTPSAWATGGSTKAIQVSTLGAVITAYGGVALGANYYLNSSIADTYITTAFACKYLQDTTTGNHYWQVAPSGTAGTSASFTNSMTLEASSNLSVTGSISSVSGSLNVGTGGTYNAGSLYSDSAWGMIFRAKQASPTIAEFMWANSADTERMRINSSGVLNVGTTTIGGVGGFTVRPLGTYCRLYLNSNGTNDVFDFSQNGTQVGRIQIATTQTFYVTTSDYRLKENIAPMVGALEKVALLKPVTYKWKLDGSDGQGFIAHELAEVIPNSVAGEKDATEEQEYEISPAIPAVLDEEGNVVTEEVPAVMGTRTVPVYQGIDTSFLVATLTAAIQELSAKVAALEAK